MIIFILYKLVKPSNEEELKKIRDILILLFLNLKLYLIYKNNIINTKYFILI